MCEQVTDTMGLHLLADTFGVRIVVLRAHPEGGVEWFTHADHDGMISCSIVVF